MSYLGTEMRNICVSVWVNINDVWGLVVDSGATLALCMWVTVTAHGNHALSCIAHPRRWGDACNQQAFLTQTLPHAPKTTLFTSKSTSHSKAFTFYF